MTRYDPFSYGEVPLDSKQPSDAAQDAEDLLFAADGPVKQAPPADDSWRSRMRRFATPPLPPGEYAITVTVDGEVRETVGVVRARQ